MSIDYFREAYHKTGGESRDKRDTYEGGSLKVS